MENNNYSEIDEISLNKKSKEKKQKLKKEEDIDPDADPFVVAYIGEDYKWIAERPFNIYALLLSWIYFLYRKMYIVGSLGLLLTALVYRFISVALIPYIIVVMICSGIFFNKIYLRVVERKVNKIAGKTESSSEAIEKCRKNGGVNVVIPLLVFAVFLAILLFISYYRINTKPKPKYWDENSYNQANCKYLCKTIYKSLDEKIKANPLESMACVISLGTKKTYNIYMKLDEFGTYRYIYYEQNNNNDLLLKGDTAYIKELEERERASELSASDREFLITSKELSTKYSSIKDDSDYENKLIIRGKDIKEKTHFIFKRDEIQK